MKSKIYKLENGDKFILQYPAKLEVKWNKVMHRFFSEKFRKICFSLLCVQKRYKNIDKNIFFMIMEKLSKDEYQIIDFKSAPLYELLYFMKRKDVNLYYDIREKINENIYVIEGSNTQENPTINIGDEIGIIKIGKINSHINFYVKKDDKVKEVVLFLKYNFLNSTQVDRRKIYKRIKHVIEEKDKNKFLKLKQFSLASSLYSFFFSVLYSFL